MLKKQLKQQRGRGGIAHSPVMIGMLDLKITANITQTVGFIAGKYLTTQSHRTQRIPVEILVQPTELPPYKSIIEGHIMRHKSGILGQSAHIVRNLFKRRRIFDHMIINARQLGNKARNPAFRIDEGLVGINDFLPVMTQNGNFGNAARVIRPAGGFNIYNGKHKEEI